MPTLHLPAAGVALAVTGDRITARGPAAALTEDYPDARQRHWDGTLGPGRCVVDAVRLLEHAYHPDPREADALGTVPLTGPALEGLEMSAVRWGHSARRGIQRLLGDGATSLVGPFTRPEVRLAVRRSGLLVREDPPPDGAERPGRPAPGERADFAVRAADGRCLATVIAGRLAHRRR